MIRDLRVRRIAGAVITTTMAIAIVSGLALFITNVPLSWAAPLSNARHSNTTLSGSSYGANHKQIQAAADAALWPQQGS